MYLGLESLYQDQPTEREFGTLTMSLTKTEFEEIKFKLRQMRKAINKDNSIARMKTKGDRVYQLNIQLFPVTNAIDGLPAKRAAAAAAAALNPKATSALASKASSQVSADSAMGAQVFAETTLAADELDPSKATNVSSLAATAASAADLFR
jgi:hypothetical protein